MSENTKTWTSTRIKHLYKHRSDVYYARIRVNGKLTWRSLRTSLLSIAEPKLKQLLKAEARKTELGIAASDWKTVSQLISARKEQIHNDVSTKPSTKVYWDEIFAALARSWPELSEKDIAKVSREECEKWAGNYSQKVSATRFNNTLSALKGVFNLAMEKGLRHTNPATTIKRRRVKQKDLSETLPTQAEFKQWVKAIRESPTGWAEDCADLVEFLSYTGLRVGESKHVLWKHCNRKTGELVVTGDPEQGTKNSRTRRVPIVANLADLLERIEKRKGIQEPDCRLLKLDSASAAMKSAADRVGINHLTHHDLRHLFATTCIESGVPIPTVAAWLGHLDGGALAMKVYGHLRNEHSLAEAKKVSFG